jgi:cation diffusion facilitator family transporter
MVHFVSLVLNVALFTSKLVVYMRSQSMSVLAALVDSTVDLLAQGILLITNRLASGAKEPAIVVLYPVGRSRAECVGVIACALIMALASAQVMRDAIAVIVDWWATGNPRPVSLNLVDMILLSSTIALKLALYFYCRFAARRTHNVTVEAAAQDNFNDVLSNAAALAAVVGAQSLPGSAFLWLLDPIGAILIAVYIIWAWVCTGMEQVDLIVGRAADPEFIDLMREMAEMHDPAATLDQIRAYHFGPKFLVEVEIVLNPDTPLRESHDVGIMLQHKIERLEQVERCFVHVDYRLRDVDDHDPHTPVEYKTQEAANLPPPPHRSARSATGAAGSPESAVHHHLSV